VTSTAAGTLVHFLAPLTVMIGVGDGLGDGRVMDFGEELLITNEADIRRVGTNGAGECWLDLIDDEKGQIARYRKVVVRRGPFPEGQLRAESGSARFLDMREAARQQAFSLRDKDARAAALKAVEQQFGPAPVTSRTNWAKPDRDEDSNDAVEA
jgi:hypothetical protein